MSMSYLLFQGLEVLSENASNFEAVYKEFADQAEDIKGRLYAMLKKLNSFGISREDFERAVRDSKRK